MLFQIMTSWVLIIRATNSQKRWNDKPFELSECDILLFDLRGVISRPGKQEWVT